MLLSVADEEAPVVHAELCCGLPRVEFVVFGRHAPSIEKEKLDMSLWSWQLDTLGRHCTECRLFVEARGYA